MKKEAGMVVGGIIVALIVLIAIIAVGAANAVVDGAFISALREYL